MNQVIIKEQKQKQVEYSEVKYYLHREIVNLRNLNSKKKLLNSNSLFIKETFQTKINNINNVNRLKSVLISKINSCIRTIINKINNKSNHELFKIFNIFEQKYIIYNEYQKINQELKNLITVHNHFVNEELYGKYEYQYRLDDRYRRILDKYKVFKYQIDYLETYDPDKKIKNFKITDFKNKYQKNLEYIENFNTNKNIFLQEIKQYNTQIKSYSDKIKLDKQKIDNMNIKFGKLSSKQSNCKDEVERAKLGVEIAELIVNIRNIESDIENNLELSTQLQNITIEEKFLNEKFLKYSEIIEKMYLLINKLNEIDNSFHENIKNLNLLKEKQNKYSLLIKEELEKFGFKISITYFNYYTDGNRKNNMDKISFLNENQISSLFQCPKIEVNGIQKLYINNLNNIFEFLKKIKNDYINSNFYANKNNDNDNDKNNDKNNKKLDFDFDLDLDLDSKLINIKDSEKEFVLQLKKTFIVNNNYSPTKSLYNPSSLFNFENFKNCSISYLNIDKIISFIDHLIEYYFKNHYYFKNDIIIIEHSNEFKENHINFTKNINECENNIIEPNYDDTNNLEKQIRLSGDRIDIYKNQLEIKKELLDEINSRVEYEKHKLDLINLE